MSPTALFALAATAASAWAAPQLVYPLMSQEPPVARVGKEFIFDLFPGTFSTTSNITYSTSSLPSWLSFNEGVQTFYGTPTAADEGEQSVTLTATDSSGAQSDTWTLITTNYSSPSVHYGFTTQLADTKLAKIASATTLSNATGVAIPPYWSFSLGFQYDTFRTSRDDNNNGRLFFEARQRGNTSLPSWLTFDNTSMTFTGVAPAEGTFNIVATGTDFWGYTAAQSSFIIEIGTGEGIELVKGYNFTDIETMSRAAVSYKVDLTGLLVGGEPAEDVVLTIDNTNFPWLSVDSSSRTISGTTPDTYINGTVSPLSLPLTIASTNTSSTLELTTYISIDISPYFFNTFSLPTATVTPGKSFSFDVAPYIANKTATVSATIPSGSTWLSYAGTTLSGDVPSSFKESTDVTFSAVAGGQTATATLLLATEGATTTGAGSTGSSSASAASASHHGLSKAAKIALGVVFGLLGLILLLLLLFCCVRRRRARHDEDKDVDDKDDASFVAASPRSPVDPFRRSAGLEPPRNLLGEISKISMFNMGNTNEPRSPERPSRMEGLKGIFGWNGQEREEEKKPVEEEENDSSFRGSGDVIGVNDPVERPSQDASSFTQSFTSGSRASWESRESFQWSMEDDTNRLSAAPSIPRPRPDFTPRYPRNNSPSKLAQLTSQHTLGSPEFSEFHSSEEDGSHFQSGSFSSMHGPATSRFGESGFHSIDEEDETSGEDAVVAMAERQSFETRQPQTTSTPRLRPSAEKIASPEGGRQYGSRRSFAAEGAFDDAEEARRSTYTAYSDASALGYPASEIIFGSPNTDARSSVQPGNRTSTIRAIPAHETPLSPPLPQVGSFVRHRRNHSQPSRPVSTDGRILACANETFSIHPPIHPPPTVSLSAATWSSNPPSTYRAEVEGGGALPSWLHFDARELELWGVPPLKNSGEVTVIRILEKMPRDKRRSDPMAFGYQPQQEREVGKIVIEVVDRMRSPQFALENSPHAL